jgi:hypothetical protein
MPEKVASTSIVPDYKAFMYYLDSKGSVVSYNKDTKRKKVLEKDVVMRQPRRLYFLKKEGENLAVFMANEPKRKK